MQEIEHDEQPELLIAHSIVYEATRANVDGYKQSPLGTHAFQGVDVSARADIAAAAAIAGHFTDIRTWNFKEKS